MWAQSPLLFVLMYSCCQSRMCYCCPFSQDSAQPSLLSNLFEQIVGGVDMLTCWHPLWSNFQGCHLWFNGSQLNSFPKNTPAPGKETYNSREKHITAACSFYGILSPGTHSCGWLTDWMSQVSKLHPSVQLLRTSSFANLLFFKYLTQSRAEDLSLQ